MTQLILCVVCAITAIIMGACFWVVVFSIDQFGTRQTLREKFTYVVAFIFLVCLVINIWATIT